MSSFLFSPFKVGGFHVLTEKTISMNCHTYAVAFQPDLLPPTQAFIRYDTHPEPDNANLWFLSAAFTLVSYKGEIFFDL
jgi:hypothetical protein